MFMLIYGTKVHLHLWLGVAFYEIEHKLKSAPAVTTQMSITHYIRYLTFAVYQSKPNNTSPVMTPPFDPNQISPHQDIP